ncbi:unnamed protein product [Clonostachys rhizophaga]|uniref:Peroxidase n=1 Tax=Clonostachys rhizophaga TaxID=160324 RepID=A0A9N9W381_9HYPO|nr:unnamed protein product [Clonostachys rhizophaga]
MSSLHSLALLLAVANAAKADYVWPTKYDHFEDMLVMHSGYRRFGFGDLVVPCSFGSNTVGRQTAAEWVRTAFHDMATFDHTTGQGGLDASIMYETESGENAGTAFNSTLSDIWEFVSPRTSVSDMIALGLVASVASCGGPEVPLRLGRIDATEAGPLGVPEPQDSLETIQADFDRMGLTTEEMIALVACGHTLGGVHSEDFPDITGPEDVSASNVPKFDNTHAEFDTAVVDEYLSNKGINPLVFGKNETTNSDKRVFAADGNATMHKLADAVTFKSTCAEVFEKMINVVPSTVTLTEPIQLIKVKPYLDTFKLSSDGSKFEVELHVRLRSTKGKGYESPPSSVTIDVLDRKGNRTSLQAAHATLKGGQSYGFFSETFDWYLLETELDAKAGVESFKIHISTTQGEEVLDNGGTGGYPFNDGVISGTQSCLDTTGTQGNVTFDLYSAVRSDLAQDLDGAPWVGFAHRMPQQGAVTPKIVVEKISMAEVSTSVDGYKFFKGKTTTPSSGWSTRYDLGITLKNGKEVTREFIRTPSTSC